jgi:hypothetical protein
MSDDRPRYQSFLLRLWQVRSKHGWGWQASLESPTTGKRLGFQTIDALVAFIEGQTQQALSLDQASQEAGASDDDMEE